jgi:glutamate/tyrosine decarboxylase-like PLP-dependent enzyme
MNQYLQADINELEVLLEKVKTHGLSYLQNIDLRSTNPKIITDNFKKLPDAGVGTSAALEIFNHQFEPIMVASSGPRYWGFVTGGTTPAAIVGDWLTTIYDQNAFATKGQGDISGIIEVNTLQLLREVFNLPKDYAGGFVTGATMSNFTSLAVARQWYGRQIGENIALDGVSSIIPVYAATPHSSSIKALSLLGLGGKNIKYVEMMGRDREAIDIEDLEVKIKANQENPFILISSAGTVNTVDYDDFKAIARLKERYNFWWHIDAAFGGFAACSTKCKHLIEGWENADSITIDCHKWLNVPYENAVFFIKEKHNLLQVETFQNSNAPYLGNPLENFNFFNFLPENSRRLKALPVWFSLMAYGKKGITEIVDNNIRLANMLGNFIHSSKMFELLAPVRLNTVCFTLTETRNPETVPSFLEKLNQTGKVFMTPTVFKGKQGIRAAMVNWRTTEKDIELVSGLMDELAKKSDKN